MKETVGVNHSKLPAVDSGWSEGPLELALAVHLCEVSTAGQDSSPTHQECQPVLLSQARTLRIGSSSSMHIVCLFALVTKGILDTSTSLLGPK